ncbi:MAG TPA: peptidoglycan-binding domain-containing protein [Actinomycetes bacterium]|nr:peptidoglycan-binding domain-containing protein [Actinomycetes bacterium]
MVAAICSAMLVAACSDDEPVDPVQAAQARVSAAQEAVNEAQTAFDEASAKFCAESKDYILAVDRYGKAFDDSSATVGDVKAVGADLSRPRETVQSSAEAAVTANEALAQANQELADAEAALKAAKSSKSTTPSSEPTTAKPLVPTATVDRVTQAESDLADAVEGITDQTPLTQATAQFNAAAFALEVAWLRLFADAGCLTSEQEKQAVAAVSDYTAALQKDLRTAGYYDGEIDGSYGPETVAAVEQLQKDNNLTVTGFVDQATDAALDTAVLAEGGEAAAEELAHTAAVQSTLKLAGYWPGAVDGKWTPELTEALKAFQDDLGVKPTGEVDAATLSALEKAIAEAKAPPPTSTSPSPTSTSS